MRNPHAIAFAALLTACTLPGCDDGTSPDEPYDPILPTAWASAVDNGFFPLVPGSECRFEAETEDGTEETLVEVLDRIERAMAAARPA